MKQQNREELSRIAGFIEGIAYACGGGVHDELTDISNRIDDILADEAKEATDAVREKFFEVDEKRKEDTECK